MYTQSSRRALATPVESLYKKLHQFTNESIPRAWSLGSLGSKDHRCMGGESRLELAYLQRRKRSRKQDELAEQQPYILQPRELGPQ